MAVYYLLTVGLNLGALILFFGSVSVSRLSLVPAFLIVLTLLQYFLFKSLKSERGYRTNYGSPLTSDEENKRNEYVSKFMLAVIPWMLPFIFFFPSPLKLLSVFVHFIGLLGGTLIHRAKHKNDILSREQNEENERIEQEKKEELGTLK